MFRKLKRRSVDFRLFWKILRGNPLTMLGLVVIVLFYFLAIFGEFLAPYDPYEIVMSRRLQAPSLTHFLGTDELGRDVFSRILSGAKYSLRVGLIVIAIAGFVGASVGVIAGWFGGRVDNFIMRTADVFLAIPGLILALAIVSALGFGLTNVMIALSITWWPWYARLIRGITLSIREKEYVIAASSSGASSFRIITKHLLPNAISPLIVTMSLDFGGVIIAAAGLSFIGFGAQPPTPEWGLMIASARAYLQLAWWLPTFPGLSIFLVVIGFNLLGDGLRDALDPRLRRSSN